MPGQTPLAPQLAVVVSGAAALGEACAGELLVAGGEARRVVLVGDGAAPPGVEQRPVPVGTSATAVVQELVAEAGPVAVLVEVPGRAVPGAHPRVSEGLGPLAELAGIVERLRLVAPGMAEAGHGRVVLVAEASSVPGRTWDDASSAAMWGLVGLARSTTREVAGTGTTVNVVRAGVVDTADLQAQRASDPTVAEAVDAAIAATPLRRLPTLHEVAATIAYLASDEAAFVTGTVIPVDGGLAMGLGS